MLQTEFLNRKKILLGIEEHNARMMMSITVLAKRVNFAKSRGRETQIKQFCRERDLDVGWRDGQIFEAFKIAKRILKTNQEICLQQIMMLLQQNLSLIVQCYV